MTTEIESPLSEATTTRDRVTIRFAGDSGDGMQLTGTQFTRTTAVYGNDLATLPDYPAEIRAPTGSLPGVSGFQLSFSSNDIHTPGDNPDALVAMNPAALKTNLGDLVPGGLLIVDEGEFNATNLRKAGYTSNPLKDGSLADYRLLEVPITKLATTAAAEAGVSGQNAERTKNFFALGMIYWLYDRDLAPSIAWIEEKFARRPAIVEANTAVVNHGRRAARAQRPGTHNPRGHHLKPTAASQHTRRVDVACPTGGGSTVPRCRIEDYSTITVAHSR